MLLKMEPDNAMKFVCHIMKEKSKKGTVLKIKVFAVKWWTSKREWLSWKLWAINFKKMYSSKDYVYDKS